MVDPRTPTVAPAWDAPPRVTAQVPAQRPETVVPLVGALAELAAAATAEEVAAAAAAGAVELTGARAAALGMQVGDEVRLIASVGYDCDSMAVGAALPLHAGLPLTEAIRTRQTVRQGVLGQPAWVAVPVPIATADGALLASLPPHAEPDVAALETLARATARALDRCHWAPTGSPQPPLEAPPWLAVAALQQVLTGGSGSGDVVVAVAGPRDDVCWVVIADVCGSGSSAADTAASVEMDIRALTLADLTPEELLATVDRGLRRRGEERFVTALAVRLDRAATGVVAALAVAGHPAALLWDGTEVRELGAESLPLNLLPDSYAGPVRCATVELPESGLLMLHTDGLVDRGADDWTPTLVELFARSATLVSPDAVLDAVAAALTATTPPARDDVAALVLSLP